MGISVDFLAILELNSIPPETAATNIVEEGHVRRPKGCLRYLGVKVTLGHTIYVMA